MLKYMIASGSSMIEENLVTLWQDRLELAHSCLDMHAPTCR